MVWTNCRAIQSQLSDKSTTFAAKSVLSRLESWKEEKIHW